MITQKLKLISFSSSWEVMANQIAFSTFDFQLKMNNNAEGFILRYPLITPLNATCQDMGADLVSSSLLGVLLLHCMEK